MNTRKRLSFLMAAFAIICFSSCQDWNEWDAPSGNQVYPTLEKVGSYTFDEELDPEVIQPFAYSGGDIPVVVDDNDRKSSVLHMDQGYARTANPLNSEKGQSAVSLTFWVKQAVLVDEDTGKKSQDLEGALFSFQNEDGTQRMFFTANGWLSYKGADGTFEHNNPSVDKTGMMSAGEWHYVALSITNEGYFVYVDGLKKIERTITNFESARIVQFMASAPYLYIGYGSDSQTQEMWIDDLTIYRNQITNSQIKVPDSGGEEEDKNYIIVGNEDFSTGWWAEFSDLVTMKGNQSMHFGFYNYTSGIENWHNWILVVTNGKDRGEDGYAEYFAIRADAYGWGPEGDTFYTNDNIIHNYNWESFTTDMQGAYIDLTLKRVDNRIDVTAIITTKAGEVYTYTTYYEGIIADTIGAFLTCERAYLEIDPETVHVGEQYAADQYRVGPSDCSAGWWQHFSNLSVISGNTLHPFVYTFYNYTNGINNWNNWVLIVTSGKDRGEDGYAEYFAIRADAYGWGPDGGNYNGDNISHSYEFGTFPAQMQGAYCKINLTRNGSRLDILVQVTTADGEQLGDYTFFYEGISTNDIGTFLTVDGSSLDIRTVGYYPFLDTNN